MQIHFFGQEVCTDRGELQSRRTPATAVRNRTMPTPRIEGEPAAPSQPVHPMYAEVLCWKGIERFAPSRGTQGRPREVAADGIMQKEPKAQPGCLKPQKAGNSWARTSFDRRRRPVSIATNTQRPVTAEVHIREHMAAASRRMGRKTTAERDRAGDRASNRPKTDRFKRRCLYPLSRPVLPWTLLRISHRIVGRSGGSAAGYPSCPLCETF